MDPKLFDPFNQVRPPRALAEDLAAALRAWDLDFKKVDRIARDLRALSSIPAERWRSLDAFVPYDPGYPCDHTATELFQVIRIWGLTHSQMAEFVGRLRAVIDEKGPKGWKDWKPDIRPSFALPGVSRAN